MIEATIRHAKMYLSRLLARVEAGEEVVISRAAKPVAKLVAIAPRKRRKRWLGMDQGKVWIADDFDAPLPAEIARHFSN